MDNSEMYQIVFLTLSDGRTVSFTGKAFCKSSDEDVTVVNIQITEPKLLPKDTKFSTFGELENETSITVKDNDD